MALIRMIKEEIINKMKERTGRIIGTIQELELELGIVNWIGITGFLRL